MFQLRDALYACLGLPPPAENIAVSGIQLGGGDILSVGNDQQSLMQSYQLE